MRLYSGRGNYAAVSGHGPCRTVSGLQLDRRKERLVVIFVVRIEILRRKLVRRKNDAGEIRRRSNLEPVSAFARAVAVVRAVLGELRYIITGGDDVVDPVGCR